jgi:hypothetical protein
VKAVLVSSYSTSYQALYGASRVVRWGRLAAAAGPVLQLHRLRVPPSELFGQYGGSSSLLVGPPEQSSGATRPARHHSNVLQQHVVAALKRLLWQTSPLPRIICRPCARNSGMLILCSASAARTGLSLCCCLVAFTAFSHCLDDGCASRSKGAGCHYLLLSNNEE